MEYVDGRTPRRDHPQPTGRSHPDRAADIAADVAAALGFAHRNGVVHRDVKPGNVLITAAGPGEGRRLRHRPGHRRRPSENLTQAGAVMGTATYFSPEQAQGHAVDARSDLYSLGVVLYEMVAGRPPFSGRQPGGHRLQARPGGAAPARRCVNPAVPAALEAIILKAWPRTRARYPSADDLRADLPRFRRGEQRRRCRWPPCRSWAPTSRS